MVVKSAAAKSTAGKEKAGKSVAKPAAKKSPAGAAKVQVGQVSAVEGGAEGDDKVVVMTRVKDLVDRVSANSELKKKDVKTIIEAALAELAKSLDAGESLNLPPMGRIRVANKRDADGAVFMTLKLRRGAEKAAGDKAPKEALADDGEAG